MVKLLVKERVVNGLLLLHIQVERSHEEKDFFWNQMVKVVSRLPLREAVFVGGDLNGHMGAAAEGNRL